MYNFLNIVIFNLIIILMGIIFEIGFCYFYLFLVFLKGENFNLFYVWFFWVEEWFGFYMFGN